VCVAAVVVGRASRGRAGWFAVIAGSLGALAATVLLVLGAS